MATLFDPVTVGDLKLANRIVMAPLTRNRSPRAVPNDLNVTYYEQRASAGLIITEATPISHQGQGYADVPGLYSDEQLAGWKRVTDAVHSAGGKIVVQMWHVGRISHDSLQPNGGKPVAPSAITAKSKTYLVHPDGTGEFAPTSEPRALEKSELPEIVATYAKAAKDAVEVAGFDGVEIHAANGYLIDQFLRDGSNHRSDAYGGSIENRTRLLFEVVSAVAEAIGPARTGVRLSPVTPVNDAHDSNPQPLFDRAVERLDTIEGLAFIHIIEGATGGDRDNLAFDYAGLRARFRGPWIANNGYDAARAEQAVASGYADMIAFGRPFIANPDLVARLRSGAALADLDPNTLYGGGEHGYTDYPALGA